MYWFFSAGHADRSSSWSGAAAFTHYKVVLTLTSAVNDRQHCLVLTPFGQIVFISFKASNSYVNKTNFGGSAPIINSIIWGNCQCFTHFDNLGSFNGMKLKEATYPKTFCDSFFLTKNIWNSGMQTCNNIIYIPLCYFSCYWYCYFFCYCHTITASSVAPATLLLLLLFLLLLLHLLLVVRCYCYFFCYQYTATATTIATATSVATATVLLLLLLPLLHCHCYCCDNLSILPGYICHISTSYCISGTTNTATTIATAATVTATTATAAIIVGTTRTTTTLTIAIISSTNAAVCQTTSSITVYTILLLLLLLVLLHSAPLPQSSGTT